MKNGLEISLDKTSEIIEKVTDAVLLVKEREVFKHQVIFPKKQKLHYEHFGGKVKLVFKADNKIEGEKDSAVEVLVCDTKLNDCRESTLNSMKMKTLLGQKYSDSEGNAYVYLGLDINEYKEFKRKISCEDKDCWKTKIVGNNSYFDTTR